VVDRFLCNVDTYSAKFNVTSHIFAVNGDPMVLKLGHFGKRSEVPGKFLNVVL
jgi:hypothetical protein